MKLMLMIVKTNMSDKKTKYIIPSDLLDEIMTEIVNYELLLETGHGSGRTINTLVKTKCMPKLYYKLLLIKSDKNKQIQ